ncbi:MAG: hypothetical protein WD904_14685 [Dehalococcoidia bacterium]
MTNEVANDVGNNWYVLLHGLELSEPAYHIASGLTLCSLESPLTVFDLAAAGSVGFREWATLEPFLNGCHSEVESALDASVTPGYDTLNRAWLMSALLTLRGFSRHVPLACNSYSWRLIAGHQERAKGQFHEQFREEGVDAAVYRPKRQLPPFKGQLLDYHLRLLADRGARRDTFDADDAEWVKVSFNPFNRLAADSDKFRFALEAAVDWRYAKDARSAISRLWSGIEAIFGVSSELVFRISLYASSLLEPRGTERKNRFNAIKKLYGQRSKAVHGEPLSAGQLAEAMNDSYQLLRGVLLQIVANGRAPTDEDLDEAVFG